MIQITCIDSDTKIGGLPHSVFLTKILYVIGEDVLKSLETYYTWKTKNNFDAYLLNEYINNQTPTQVINKLREFQKTKEINKL